MVSLAEGINALPKLVAALEVARCDLVIMANKVARLEAKVASDAGVIAILNTDAVRHHDHIVRLTSDLLHAHRQLNRMTRITSDIEGLREEVREVKQETLWVRIKHRIQEGI